MPFTVIGSFHRTHLMNKITFNYKQKNANLRVNNIWPHPWLQAQGAMEEESTVEKDLLDLLQIMDNFTPLIPPALLTHYLTKAGVDCDDHRL